MEEKIIKQTAEYIYNAQVNKNDIPKLTATSLPDLTFDEAYEIQRELIRLYEADNHVVLAPKMGLTSRAKMEQMGVENPIYGYIFEDFVETGNSMKFTDYIHPKVEPEIGVVLKQDLQGTNVTKEDVLENIDYVFSCAEIIDSRYQNFDFTFADVIADNTSAAGAFFSEGKKYSDFKSLDQEKAVVKINGEIQTEGSGEAVLGHPAEAIAYLVNMFGEEGRPVKAGQPIMTGGMTSASLLNVGDEVEITYSTLDPINFTVK